MLSAFVKLLRPDQWIKNAFVFAGLIFGHVWTEPGVVLSVGVVAGAFCLLSSGVYVFNDIMDREGDRQHPKKRHRPVASGKISIGVAAILSIVLIAAAFGIGWLVSSAAFLIFLGYAGINLLYTWRLKHVVILDVFCISTGFMLRILAGTLGVGIPPSHWLILCGLMITLFLGFSKRRAELIALNPESQAGHRKVLANYNHQILDVMMTVSVTATILTYSLYTVSADTVVQHGTDSLIYTVPFVIYGLFRYLFLLYRYNGGGDPSREIFTDPHMIGAFAGWFGTTFWLLS